MTHTNKEHRVLHFHEAAIPLINAVGKSGILEGMAKLETASQPSRVAKEYADAQKKIAETHSDKDRFMKAADLLYQIHYGSEQKQETETKKTKAVENKEQTASPEPLLMALIHDVGCKMLWNQFQQEMEKAVSTGNSYHLEVASQKFDMLQKLVLEKQKYTASLNSKFPMGKLGVKEFDGSQFALNDQLMVALVNLPAESWKDVSSLGGKLGVVHDDSGAQIVLQEKTDSEKETLNALRRREVYLASEVKDQPWSKELATELEQTRRQIVTLDPTGVAKEKMQKKIEESQRKKSARAEMYELTMQLQVLRSTTRHGEKGANGWPIRSDAVEELEKKIKELAKKY